MIKLGEVGLLETVIDSHYQIRRTRPVRETMIKLDKFSQVHKDIDETLTHKKVIQQLNKTCATLTFSTRLAHQERSCQKA